MGCNGWAAGAAGLVCVFGVWGCSQSSTGSQQQSVRDPKCGLSGAVFTTFDAQMGGCDNGKGIDCNIYEAKADVYLTGGPGPSSLENGTYFWAVLVPGSQNGGWKDGAAGNLSDNIGNGDAGSGDVMANRTFTVTNGVITYGGTHHEGTDPQGDLAIQLVPYDDTTNNGGEYILAVCKTTAVSDCDCKFDAFKVKKVEQVDMASPPPPPPDMAVPPPPPPDLSCPPPPPDLSTPPDLSQPPCPTPTAPM